MTLNELRDLAISTYNLNYDQNIVLGKGHCYFNKKQSERYFIYFTPDYLGIFQFDEANLTGIKCLIPRAEITSFLIQKQAANSKLSFVYHGMPFTAFLPHQFRGNSWIQDNIQKLEKCQYYQNENRK